MILLAVIFPIIIGFLALCLIMDKREDGLAALEMFALSYLLGTSLITIQMFIYVLLKVNFNPASIALPWVLLLPALKLAPRKYNFSFKLSHPAELALFVLIGIKTAYIFFEALIKPVVGWDAIWNFSLRAKIFYLEKTIPLVSSSPFFLGGGMKQYPIQIPLLETWTYLVMNDWNDLLMKAIFPLYFVSLIIIFYYAIRNEKSRMQSLFFTFLLTSLPMLTYHASIEYADFVVGTYFLAAAVFLYRYINTQKPRFLVLSSILACFGGWVKDEGVIFYAICLFVLFLFNGL